MQVLQLIDSLAQGGAERSLLDLAPHLRAQGVEPTVLLLKGGGVLIAQAEALQIPVEVLAGSSAPAQVRALHARLRTAPPGVLHTSLFAATQVGRLAAVGTGVPVLTSLVSTPYGPDQRARLGRIRLAVVQALDVATARRTTAFHANAQHVADVMARRLRVPRQRIRVIHRGRDPEALGHREPQRRAAARAALGVGDARVVLALARHEHQKGLDVLVATLREAGDALAQVVVLVAGREGNESEALRAQISRGGLTERVHLLGDRRDVDELLCAADVFVLPSRREGFPGVLLEAMALEAPIVTTDIPGAREALGPDDAMFVPIDDTAALARALENTLADPMAAAERAAHARRAFEQRFTTAAIAHQMADLYRSVAAGAGVSS